MAKDYTADKVRNLFLRIKFSTPDDPVSKVNEVTRKTEYFAAVQKLQCFAQNGKMEVPVTVADEYLGAPKTVPWTAKEVGDAIKNYSNFNTALYNDLKAIYLDAINEDIT